MDARFTSSMTWPQLYAFAQPLARMLGNHETFVVTVVLNHTTV